MSAEESEDEGEQERPDLEGQMVFKGDFDREQDN